VAGVPVGEPLVGHQHDVVALAGAGKNRLASAGIDGEIRVWETRADPPGATRISGVVGYADSFAVLNRPDGSTHLLSTGTRGRTSRGIDLWDARTGALAAEPRPDHSGPLVPVALPDGRTVLVVGRDRNRLQVWDPDGVATLASPPVRDLSGHIGFIASACAIQLEADRRLVACGTEDGQVRLYDPDAGTEFGEPMEGHTGPVYGLATVPLPDGRTGLVSGGDDGTVRRWDPATGACLGVLPIGIAVCALYRWNNLLAIGTRSGVVVLNVAATPPPASPPPPST